MRDGQGYIDLPFESDDKPLCTREGIVETGSMYGGIDVLKEFTKDGRQGLTLRFSSVRHAANWHETFRADVFSIELEFPITKFHVPTAVTVILLDLNRDNWPAWHRARCSGCVLCHVV